MVERSFVLENTRTINVLFISLAKRHFQGPFSNLRKLYFINMPVLVC